MGFGTGKSNKSSNEKQSPKSDKPFRKIGSIWKNESKDGEFFSFTADDYSGDLIFVDKASGQFFKVLSGNLMAPLDGAPEKLQFNISINLSKTPDSTKYPSVKIMGQDE